MTTRNYDASIIQKIRQFPQIYRGDQNGAIYDFARGIVPFVNPPYPVPPTQPPAPGSFVWAAQVDILTNATSGTIIPFLKCDNNGNVYFACKFIDRSLFFNPGDPNLIVDRMQIIDNTTSSMFIARYSSSGNVDWITRCSSGDLSILTSLSIDTTDNIYIASNCKVGASTFNASNTLLAVSTFGSSANIMEIFIVKYDNNGTNHWLARISGSPTIVGQEVNTPTITATPNGILYVAGAYKAKFSTFNAGSHLVVISTLSTTSAATNDVFLSQYDTNGINSWVVRLAGSNDDINPILANGENDSIYISGQYKGNFSTFNSADQFAKISSISSSSAVFNDFFLVKYNTNGTNSWLAKIGGTNEKFNPHIAYSATNNVIYLASQFRNGLSTFNADNSLASTLNNLKSGTLQDMFLAQYSSSGVNNWIAKIGGGTGDLVNSYIASDNLGNVYVVGQFTKNISTFNSDSETVEISSISNLSTLLYDIFIAKYDMFGRNKWLTKIGSSLDDIFPAVIADNLGSIYIAGHYTSDIGFYNTGNQNLSVSTLYRNGDYNVLIAKMVA